MTTHFYPIGIEGQPWSDSERQSWYENTTIKRSYQRDVLDRISQLDSTFQLHQYGALSIDAERYPLFALLSLPRRELLPTVLITGGVHGYETSGVQGALDFAEYHAQQYVAHFNLIIVPCVSPWGYETINRWNNRCVDPNRSFIANSPSEEAAQLIAFMSQQPDILIHVDLHETTDSDEQEFRPALAARDGKTYQPGEVPDGFYTVGNTASPELAFQAAVIDSVAAITHIAPADSHNQIIGSDVVAHGVILYPMKNLGLCGSLTNCQYGTTTEVYPDSPSASPEICNRAQVAAIQGGLDFVIRTQELER
ncbi:M14 family metallocarboxypeptidase [uncultured Umboniibacter sp.]|uniref:M14 family metallopeptidase n=1 Tax=uncultured Umboniibacter sp. TaxID=1798917 RepID=UPI00261D447D|nr:M14 family metallocarboxypeptidase [uncultured Umboniibacter sp.]